jgi:glycosyltransferase involved in cell wall biosynthesis
MKPRILIVTPARNEAAHIERVVRAVAAQSLLPACWIVVDDRSTDDTLARLRALERDVAFMDVVQAPELGGDTRDRLAVAAEVRSFDAGLAHARTQDYTHIMKLDADIELPADYLEQLVRRFERDERLGVAGGALAEPAEGGLKRITVPRHHVHGAVKCYTRACFEAIGGIPARLGWDTIDETYARMLGFGTETFPELLSIHHRPFASADGILRGRARHGECAYIAHYGPVWIALRALKVSRFRPVGLSGLAFLFGYARAALRRVPRVDDPEFRNFTRRELRQRMLGALVPRWS